MAKRKSRGLYDIMPARTVVEPRETTPLFAPSSRTPTQEAEQAGSAEERINARIAKIVADQMYAERQQPQQHPNAVKSRMLGEVAPAPEPKRPPKTVRTPDELGEANREYRADINAAEEAADEAERHIQAYREEAHTAYGAKAIDQDEYLKRLGLASVESERIAAERKSIKSSYEKANEAEEVQKIIDENTGGTFEDKVMTGAETVGKALQTVTSIPVLKQAFDAMAFIGSGLGNVAALSEHAIAGAMLRAEGKSEDQIRMILEDEEVGSQIGKEQRKYREGFLERLSDDEAGNAEEDYSTTFGKAVDVGAGYAGARSSEAIYETTGSRVAALIGGIGIGMATDPLSYVGKPSLMGLPASIAKTAGVHAPKTFSGLAKVASLTTRAATNLTQRIPGVRRVAPTLDRGITMFDKASDALFPTRLIKASNKLVHFLEPKRSAVLKSFRLDRGKNKVPSRAITTLGFVREQEKIAMKAVEYSARAKAAQLLAGSVDDILHTGVASTDGVAGSGRVVEMAEIIASPQEKKAILDAITEWGDSADEAFGIEDAMRKHGVDAAVMGRFAAASLDAKQAAKGHLLLESAVDAKGFRNEAAKNLYKALPKDEADQALAALDSIIEASRDAKWSAVYVGKTAGARIKAGQTIASDLMLPPDVWKKAILPLYSGMDKITGLSTMWKWLRTSFISDYARDPDTLAWHAAQVAAASDWNAKLGAFAAQSTERIMEIMTRKRIERSGGMFKVIDENNKVLAEAAVRSTAVNFLKSVSDIDEERAAELYRATRMMIEKPSEYASFVAPMKLTAREQLVVRELSKELTNDWRYLLNFTQGMGVRVSEFVDDVIEGYFARAWTPELRQKILNTPELRAIIRDANEFQYFKNTGQRVPTSNQFHAREARGLTAEELEVIVRDKLKLAPDEKVFDTDPTRIMNGGFKRAGRAITAQRRLASGVETFGKKASTSAVMSGIKAVQERVTEIREGVAHKLNKMRDYLEANVKAKADDVSAGVERELKLLNAKKLRDQQIKFWRDREKQARDNYKAVSNSRNRQIYEEARKARIDWETKGRGLAAEERKAGRELASEVRSAGREQSKVVLREAREKANYWRRAAREVRKELKGSSREVIAKVIRVAREKEKYWREAANEAARPLVNRVQTVRREFGKRYAASSKARGIDPTPTGPRLDMKDYAESGEVSSRLGQLARATDEELSANPPARVVSKAPGGKSMFGDDAVPTPTGAAEELDHVPIEWADGTQTKIPLDEWSQAAEAEAKIAGKSADEIEDYKILRRWAQDEYKAQRKLFPEPTGRGERELETLHETAQSAEESFKQWKANTPNWKELQRKKDPEYTNRLKAWWDAEARYQRIKKGGDVVEAADDVVETTPTPAASGPLTPELQKALDDAVGDITESASASKARGTVTLDDGAVVTRQQFESEYLVHGSSNPKKLDVINPSAQRRGRDSPAGYSFYYPATKTSAGYWDVNRELLNYSVPSNEIGDPVGGFIYVVKRPDDAVDASKVLVDDLDFARRTTGVPEKRPAGREGEIVSSKSAPVVAVILRKEFEKFVKENPTGSVYDFLSTKSIGDKKLRTGDAAVPLAESDVADVVRGLIKDESLRPSARKFLEEMASEATSEAVGGIRSIERQAGNRKTAIAHEALSETRGSMGELAEDMANAERGAGNRRLQIMSEGNAEALSIERKAEREAQSIRLEGERTANKVEKQHIRLGQREVEKGHRKIVSSEKSLRGEAERRQQEIGRSKQRVEREYGNAKQRAERTHGKQRLRAEKDKRNALDKSKQGARGLGDGGKTLHKAVKLAGKDESSARIMFDDEASLIAANKDPDMLSAKGRSELVRGALRRAGLLPNGKTALDVLEEGGASPPLDWNKLVELGTTVVDQADVDMLLDNKHVVTSKNKWSSGFKNAVEMWQEFLTSQRKSVLANPRSLGKDVISNIGYSVSAGTDSTHFPEAFALAQDVASPKHQQLRAIGVITDVSTADIGTLETATSQAAKTPSKFGALGESVKDYGYLGAIPRTVGRVIGGIGKKLFGKGDAVIAGGETLAKKTGEVTDAMLNARVVQDNVHRVAHFLTMKARGMTDEAAAAMVIRNFGNYSEYTKLEANVLRNIFFFHAWQSRALLATTMSFMSRPFAARAMLALAAGNTSAHEEAKTWIRNGHTTGIDEDGYERVMKMSFAGHYDPMAAVNDTETVEYMERKGRWETRERTPLGIVGAVGRDIIRKTPPPVKAAFEAAADIDLYTLQGLSNDPKDAAATRSASAPAALRFISSKTLLDIIDFKPVADADGNVYRYEMNPEYRTLIQGAFPGLSAIAAYASSLTEEGDEFKTNLMETFGFTRERAYKRSEFNTAKGRVRKVLTKLVSDSKAKHGDLVSIYPDVSAPDIVLNQKSDYGRSVMERAKRYAATKGTNERDEIRDILFREKRGLLADIDMSRRLNAALEAFTDFESSEGKKVNDADKPDTERQKAIATVKERLVARTPGEQAAQRKIDSNKRLADKDKQLKALEAANGGARQSGQVPAGR